MGKRLETRRLAADTLRRAVRCDQIWMFGLKRLQTLEKLVEFVIRYLGGVGLIVEITVPVDLGPQGVNSFFYVCSALLFCDDTTRHRPCSTCSIFLGARLPTCSRNRSLSIVNI